MKNTDFKTKDFFYHLPEALIAQTPLAERNHSKLLVLNRSNGEIKDDKFYNLQNHLKKGDCLILNDSRVLPARIYGYKKMPENFNFGGQNPGTVEFLLLNKATDTQYANQADVWEVIAGPGKRAKEGNTIIFGDGALTAEVLRVTEDGNRIVRFDYDKSDGENLYSTLEKIGEMPLPHYITEKLEDKERYQTVYSKELGSAAAPTAGLHFTPEQLESICEMGVEIGYVTLHVGLGTFRPVKVDNITDHKMHSEHYEVSFETAELIKQTKAKGGRIIAVGTTACRTLESVGDSLFQSKENQFEGWTDIFIYPGYKFKVIDGLLTNFHLPESTLIMLVSAFAGYDNTMRAYEHAVENKYRFFSFGDSSLFI